MCDFCENTALVAEQSSNEAEPLEQNHSTI